MRKYFTATALGTAVVCTTLWAQQPEPKPAAVASDAINDDGRTEPATGKKPTANSSGRYALPARAAANSGSYRPENQASQPSLPQATYTFPGNNMPVPSYPVAPYSGYGPVQYYTPVMYPVGTNAEDMQSAREFATTLQALRSAKTEEEKADLRTKMNDQVSEQLDRDLSSREKQLAEIEAKVKELRDQLQQRKQNKAEIQKMIIMLAENPQSGLLPPAWMNVITGPSMQPSPNYSTRYDNP